MNINNLRVSTQNENEKIKIKNLANDLETLANNLYYFAEYGATVETLDSICSSLADIAIDLKYCNRDLERLAECAISTNW